MALPHVARFTDAALRAPPGLPEASRWFLATVKIPPNYGFARVKDRDDHVCANPECGRRCLRNEAHHLKWKSLGGDDALVNGTTLCRVCHLRGIHARRLWAERVDVEGREALLWTWPDGRRVLTFREPSPWGAP